MSSKCIVLIAVVAIVAATSSAQQSASSPSATMPASADMVQLNFPENMEIKIFLEYVGKRLGINILYDDAVSKKRVTVFAPSRVPKESLPGLLQSVLKMSGLMLIDAEQPGWKKLVPSQDMLSLTTTMEQDPNILTSAEGTSAITQVFELKNVTTVFADQVIKPFLSKPGGNTFQIADKGIIIATDYASNLRRVAAMLEMMDRPGEKAKISFVPARHLEAGELAKQVTSLLADKDRLSATAGKPIARKLMLVPDPRGNQIIIISAEGGDEEAMDLIKTLDVPTNVVTTSYRLRYIAPQRIDQLAKEYAGMEKAAVLYKSSMIPESGLLIVTAPPEIHKHIATLAKELDIADSASTETSFIRFYKLMNATAADVLATIRAMDSGDKGLAGMMDDANGVSAAAAAVSAERFTGPNNPPGAPGVEAPTPPAYHATATSQPGAPKSSGAAKMVAKTKDALVTVDTNTNTIIVVAPPNVQKMYTQLISMLDRRRPQVMIEVTLVTLDTSDNFSLGIDTSRSDFLCNTGNPYLIFNSFGLSTVNTTTGQLSLIPGIGFNGILLDNDIANIVIKALASNGHAKVVSAPKVLVNDNSTASLSSVSEAPFTSVNASQTVSTTSFAGYASAGTTIAVTPHISEGDHLQLNYSVTLNSFTGQGSGGVPPPRQTNTLNSNVTIPNGNAIVVGGLTRKDDSNTVTKIPFVGDIPWIEYLFSSRSRANTQSTLFVFIRPVILRDDNFEDLKYLSERDLAMAQMPSDLPASEPLIIP